MHFACNAFDAASKFHLFDIRIVCQHQLQPPAGKNSTKLVILYRFVNVVKLRNLINVQKKAKTLYENLIKCNSISICKRSQTKDSNKRAEDIDIEYIVWNLSLWKKWS